ncbi:MAG TPA: ABC transporter permease [Acidobacteriaceae bacterium]|nr:ABC transporter permease [Acidobacteriaceae bacterium]
MQQLWQNLRFSLRMLGRRPGLAITVLLTLALGIGANTAIFTVDYATLLAPLPYPHPDQLVVVWSKIQSGDSTTSVGDFLEWKRRATVFQDLGAWTGRSFNAATRDQPEYLPAVVETPGLFSTIGEPLLMGRDFLPQEGVQGHDHVVILTHKLWLKMGANPHILGTTLRLDGEPYTVVGVQRAGINDRDPAQLTVPLVFSPDQMNHDFHWLLVIGRLKPGITIRQAQARMDAISAELAQEFPKSNRGWSAAVEPLKNDFIPPDRIHMLWLLLGAVGFVLLIACVNVANLLLARGMARQREMGVRSALGAPRRTIFGQLLTETLALALIGGMLGVAVGYGLLQGLIAAMPEGTLPSEADLRLNIPVLLFTLVSTTLAGILAGSVPAWFASRTDPGEVLKEGGRTGTSAGKHRIRRMLVVGEFTLALTLLAGAGLAIHSFWNLAHVDLGIRPDHVLTFLLPLPETHSKNPAELTAYYRDILSHVDAVPGVEHATAATGLPLYGPRFGMPFTIVGGQTYSDPSQRPSAAFGMVTPGFFATFGVRLVRGRVFTDQDTASTPRVAMVNESFAEKYFSGMDPFRQQIVLEQLFPGVAKLGPPQEWQVVGIFHDMHAADTRTVRPEILVPFWQSPWPQTAFGVRTAENPLTMLPSVAAAVHAVDPEIALAEPQSMEQIRDATMASERFTMLLFASFAVVALFLAAVGIYGVMAFSVAQRSHEIALRMALGATRTRVVGLIVGEGAALAGFGLALGLIGSWFVGRAMQSFLFGVRALDVVAFLAVGALLLVAALLASFLPARRAASIEPMRTLRNE